MATLLAVIFLNEKLNLFIVLGTAMIAAGIVLLAFRRGKVRINRKYLAVAIAGSLLVGVSAIMSKAALDISDMPIGGLAVSFSVGLAVQLVIIAALNKTRELPRTVDKSELFLIGGIFSALAFSFYNLSVSEGIVSIVFPLVATQPIFVLLLSWIFLKKHEKITKSLITGTVMIVAGAALLTIMKGF